MKRRDSGKKREDPNFLLGRGRVTRPKAGSRQAKTAYEKTLRRMAEVGDHVDRALTQWSLEMPDIETNGADVLSRAQRLVLESRERIDANLAHHGLDAGEFDVLSVLRRSGSPFAMRPTEIYTALLISSGGLTARLDKLEEAGLIRRKPSEKDGRSIIVELTPAGRKKIETAFRDEMDIENKMVESLSDSERNELVRLLRKLTYAMRK